MHPSQVDPLNGYALLTVALMGCIGPVFTLFLLRSHGIIEHFSTILTTTSWLANSAVLLALANNLKNPLDITTINRVVRNLSGSPFCGDSSALALCQEWVGKSPLETLSEFYDQSTLPNRAMVKYIWAYNTGVFFVILALQLREFTRERYYGARLKSAFRMVPGLKGTLEAGLLWKFERVINSNGIWMTVLTLNTLLFILTLVYEYSMVRVYADMDVIDKDGWKFGQVVALMLWVPLLLEAMNLEILERIIGEYIQ